jgi:hypothetical protein
VQHVSWFFDVQVLSVRRSTAIEKVKRGASVGWTGSGEGMIQRLGSRDQRPEDGPWTSKHTCEDGDGDGVDRSQDNDQTKSRQAHEHLCVRQSRTSGTHVEIVEKA